MRCIRLAVAVAVGAAVWGFLDSSAPRRAQAGPPAGDVVKSSEHFRVTCHGLNAAVADASLESAEAAWRIVGATFPDAPVLRHAAPLQIHVYRRFTEFKAACALLGAEALAAERWNLAFPGTLTAYVWFRPECTDDVMPRVGVPWEHRRRVAHEAAHLATFERFRGGGWLPNWFKEGVATYAEQPSLAAMGFPQEPLHEPTSGGWMAACRRIRRGGRLPAASALFLDRLEPLDKWEGIAVSWAFFRFLLEPERVKRARTLFQDVGQLKTGAGAAEKTLAAAQKAWGAEGVDAMSGEFGRYVDSLAAEWDLCSGDFSVHGGRWIQASDNGCGLTWRQGDVGRSEYAVDGAFEIEPGRKGTMAMVLLGRTDARFVVVCFDAGSSVSVFEGRTGKTAADIQWTWMGEAKKHAPTLGVATRFEVRAAKGFVHVKLGDRDVLSVDVKDRDVTGPWGVGASDGALVIWDGVALR